MIMWPSWGEQTFVHPVHEGSIWNLGLTGPVGLVIQRKKIFKVFSQYKSILNNLSFRKKVKVNPRLLFFKLYLAHVPNAAF